MALVDRQQRYRSHGSGKGLVRVEVLVPPSAKKEILILAAKLRAEARTPSTWTDVHEALFVEAVAKHQARCLWNIEPTRTPEGLGTIADRLRANGGMDAWTLATRIREVLSSAA